MKVRLDTTPERSALMKRVRRTDTAPELAVRRYLHREGFRYRVNVQHLPGSPDIVLRRYRTVVFVHGCFWHGHRCSHGAVAARTNAEYWREKIEANRARDEKKKLALAGIGWSVETVFECQVSDEKTLRALVARLRRRAVLSASAARAGTRRRSAGSRRS